jgi:uncharacterized damage-inducible protein DinB
MTLPPRTDPPFDADEAATLYGYLDYHRATLLRKTDGLDAAGLAATHPPSTMTLGGMVKHLAYVEDNWFVEFFLGQEAPQPWRDADWDADPDWEWTTGATDDAAALRAQFEQTVARSRSVVEGVDLGTLSARRLRRPDVQVSLRWIVVHLIEEYARHNGHADLIRESIDGSVGE